MVDILQRWFCSDSFLYLPLTILPYHKKYSEGVGGHQKFLVHYCSQDIYFNYLVFCIDARILYLQFLSMCYSYVMINFFKSTDINVLLFKKVGLTLQECNKLILFNFRIYNNSPYNIHFYQNYCLVILYLCMESLCPWTKWVGVTSLSLYFIFFTERLTFIHEATHYIFYDVRLMN